LSDVGQLPVLILLTVVTAEKHRKQSKHAPVLEQGDEGFGFLFGCRSFLQFDQTTITSDHQIYRSAVLGKGDSRGGRMSQLVKMDERMMTRKAR
jgi:hypothetical protein